MDTTDDPAFHVLQELTRNFRGLADALARQGEARPDYIANALVTAGLSHMVEHIGARNVADWLRKQADSIETIDESAPLMRLQ